MFTWLRGCLYCLLSSVAGVMRLLIVRWFGFSDTHFRLKAVGAGSCRSSTVCCHLPRQSGTCVMESYFLCSFPDQMGEFKPPVPVNNYVSSSPDWLCIGRNKDQWSQCGDGKQEKYLLIGGSSLLKLFTDSGISPLYQSTLTFCVCLP